MYDDSKICIDDITSDWQAYSFTKELASSVGTGTRNKHLVVKVYPFTTQIVFYVRLNGSDLPVTAYHNHIQDAIFEYNHI